MLFELEGLENSIEFDVETQKATVTIDKAGEYKVIFADYSEGAFASADMEVVTLDLGENEVASSNITLDVGDKVFLWDSANLAPLCECEIIE